MRHELGVSMLSWSQSLYDTGRIIGFICMDLLRIGDASLHSGWEVHRFGNGESFSFAFVGDGDVGAQGEDALLRWNLQFRIDIMGHVHELGERWSAKDGVVGGVEVCHKEIHVLGMEVVGAAKLDWQSDLP